MSKIETCNEIQVSNVIEYRYPWFVKLYKGRLVITIKDINELLGMEINLNKLKQRTNIFNRKDWNGLGQGKLREEFERINNVHYEEETFFFVYLTGLLKILKILMDEDNISLYEAENILKKIDHNNVNCISIT